MGGPTDEDVPNPEMRLELANTSIEGSDPKVRKVQTYHSLDEVMRASSPYDLVDDVHENSRYLVFFRLEFESDVSVGELGGVVGGEERECGKGRRERVKVVMKHQGEIVRRGRCVQTRPE